MCPRWAWGFLLVVNPLLVTFFQLRLTRRVAGIPAARRWVVAMLLMGLPFLALGVSSLLPVIVLILVLFVIGEMLWVPVSQSAVAGLAPEDLRGAYMGAFGGTAAMGFALAPFMGLQVRGAAGDTADVGGVRGRRRDQRGARRDRDPGYRRPARSPGRLCCT